MGRGRTLDIPRMESIGGWKTIKTFAKEEGMTVQAIYLRVKKGYVDAADFGGVVVVKPKSVVGGSKLNRGL